LLYNKFVFEFEQYAIYYTCIGYAYGLALKKENAFPTPEDFY